LSREQSRFVDFAKVSLQRGLKVVSLGFDPSLAQQTNFVIAQILGVAVH
jgi:hypothetical protein